MRTLNGKPFPVRLAGDSSRQRARRAAVRSRTSSSTTRAARSTTRTCRARSRAFTGNGELDILFPAFTAFHRFQRRRDVARPAHDRVSLSSISRALGGIVSGTATLDSSWLDVRFSNADLDASGRAGRAVARDRQRPHHVRRTFMAYDVDARRAAALADDAGALVSEAAAARTVQRTDRGEGHVARSRDRDVAAEARPARSASTAAWTSTRSADSARTVTASSAR